MIEEVTTEEVLRYYSPEGFEVKELIDRILDGEIGSEELYNYGRDVILPELLRLDTFAKGIAALEPGHPVKSLPIIRALLVKRDDLEFRVREIEGFLFSYPFYRTHMPRTLKLED